ncbi:MAG: hypothetical protein FVQ81_06585 [Candidatus Glassbacteria bacterium]|nr:hypothetical protein [Candidatus Glassbacteria bacterium]
MKTDDRKKDNSMCKHKHLVFLGKQEMPAKEHFLALFNCLDCCSTIALKMAKEAGRSKGNLSRSA